MPDEPKYTRTASRHGEPEEVFPQTVETPEPAHPEPEDYPQPPVAPAAIDPTAVDTVIGGKKYGWQNEPVRLIAESMACVHLGRVAASLQLVAHEIGHEWICACGAVFVVKLNAGGKKVLTLKEEEEETL